MAVTQDFIQRLFRNLAQEGYKRLWGGIRLDPHSNCVINIQTYLNKVTFGDVVLFTVRTLNTQPRGLGLSFKKLSRDSA